jgi:D-aminopeptidase
MNSRKPDSWLQFAGFFLFSFLPGCVLSVAFLSSALAQKTTPSHVPAEPRLRARSFKIAPGPLPTGKWNAITDVSGIRVGQVTLMEGDNVRTGVTAILPPSANPFKDKLPAAIFVGNGFGKLIGYTQVEELGVLETPIVLTNTLSVWQAADALAEYMLALPGNEDVQSVNPLVGETNDGYLNDIRGRHVSTEHVLTALQQAKSGEVEEGSVGAGTGTVAFGWKGGIGTSSRVLPPEKGGYTLGVLVQTNFGGRLTVDGVPVWKELKPKPRRSSRSNQSLPATKSSAADGSCMIVIATDAPLDARQLKRISKRALAGMARTGSAFSNGSGDYVISFSTAREFQSLTGNSFISARATLHDEDLTLFFEGVADATEEAIYNSLFKATTVRGQDGNEVEAVPLNELNRILNKYGRGTERPITP